MASGYEKSDDYGGPEPDFKLIAIAVLVAVLLVVYGYRLVG